jgi:DNA-binding CsgD family transcriptional regulator
MAQGVSVVNMDGLHFRCWMWPLDSPEIAVCALGMSVPKELADITEREMSCLQLLALGLPVTEIAERLDISVSTVHTHLRRAREALKLDHFEALISFAARFCYPPAEALARSESA